ncbi:MAG TPA: ATP-dependent DNA helicase RecG [Thermomicrobiales bacterium]|nr:ATP-dependent DNA helicase RecG [Thermomicrobiales bacterium]
MIDNALEALRRQWRAGFHDRIAHGMARAAVTRIRPSAASAQASSALNAIERRLDEYPTLDDEARAVALKAMAADLEALRTLLDGATAPAAPKGKLQSAISPRGSGPAAQQAPAPPPAVKPLAPSDPVTRLPKVGPAVAKKLAAHRAGITTVSDLLELAPARHIDYSRTEPVGAALRSRPGTDVTVKGSLIELREIKASGPPRVMARLSDGTGWMRITWFNSFIAKQLRVGDEIVVSGKIEADFGPLSFTNPEWEVADGTGLSTGRLTPIYPLTKGLHQKSLRALTRSALDATRGSILDPLPDSIRDDFSLVPLAGAYEQAHYPESDATLDAAKRRLAFDDLFLLQLGHIRRRRDRKAEQGVPLQTDTDLLVRFTSQLPFSLTKDQHQALEQILDDLAKPEPMTRLLQGDVGSGKTVVAAATTLMATTHGHQVAIMAPTEILAEQHYQNFTSLFAGLPGEDRPAVALLTGSSTAPERRKVTEGMTSGAINVVVGTHALIQKGVAFPNLGLAVVDEQHRFGVRQRADLPGKSEGVYPHVLSMTATPIPRTLNLVLNGDLDVSVISELPPGRTPVETRRYFGHERNAAHELVRAQVRAGRQAFVICPLVEESETIEAKAATAEFQRLRDDVFPDLSVALLHGRMKGRDKDAVMAAFRDREHDILVATSVIEVGIDIPNATVMVVEGADRFGLSQLHQFRGRVGRGGAQSYCLLLADEATPEAEQRLETMVSTNDGFLLAQKDLELRGPGDFIGTRQSGLPELSWLDGSFDTRLLDQARQAAEQILAEDPELSSLAHQGLKDRLDAFWLKASPDIPL